MGAYIRGANNRREGGIISGSERVKTFNVLFSSFETA